MHSKKFRYPLLAVGGFCFGLSLILGLGESGAVYQRLPGMTCQPASDHALTYLTQTYGSWLENNTWSGQSYVCPIPSTEDLPLSDIATILIDVYDGNNDDVDVNALNAVRIRACSYGITVAPPGEYSECDGEYGISNGNPYSDTFSGPQRLVIDSFDAQFDLRDSMYLMVSLPALDASVSRINSIYITD